MIFNPVVSSGGAGGSAWKEVDRGYIAEHYQDQNANFLVAVFTTDIPNQPLIIPAGDLFGIGNLNGEASACVQGSMTSELAKIYYVYSLGVTAGISTDPNGHDIILALDLYDSSGSDDIIPEGWSIKYYIYGE